MRGKKSSKRIPKYIADAAIRNTVLTDDSLLSDPAEMGKTVETVVICMLWFIITSRRHLLDIFEEEKRQGDCYCYQVYKYKECFD